MKIISLSKPVEPFPHEGDSLAEWMDSPEGRERLKQASRDGLGIIALPSRRPKEPHTEKH